MSLKPQLSRQLSRNETPSQRGETLRKGWLTTIALALVVSATGMAALNWLQPALFSTSAISATLLLAVLLGIIIVTKSPDAS